MPVVSMKQLLEAGVHFGHQTRRWNPKMNRYIFTQRNGIHIIDLQKTVMGLDEAFNYARELAASGEKMLFVGTKKQAQEAVRDEATRAGQFYVNQRWLGGLLTNFKTIQERLRRLDELERMKQTGEMDLRPKKEQLRLQDEMTKLNRILGGIRTMRRLPAALFIVDCQKEHLAVHEATRLAIPIVALVDTNVDPDPVEYPIPANDDAIRAVRLLAGKIADATIEGQQMRESMMAEQAIEVQDEPSLAASLEDEDSVPISLDVGSDLEEVAALPGLDVGAVQSEVEGIPDPAAMENAEATATRPVIEEQADLRDDSGHGGATAQSDPLEPGNRGDATESDSEAIPESVEAVDLSDDQQVVPIGGTDDLNPLPDLEGGSTPTNEERSPTIEATEGENA